MSDPETFHIHLSLARKMSEDAFRKLGLFGHGPSRPPYLWEEKPPRKEWHHEWWKSGGFLTSKLDEAGVENCLWGFVHSQVLQSGVGEGYMNEIEFIVPDSQIERAAGAIIEAGGVICNNIHCPSNPEAKVEWRDSLLDPISLPLPPVHLHHKDDRWNDSGTALTGKPRCPVWLSPQSRFLWFLPDLKLDNRNILPVAHQDFGWRMGENTYMIPIEYMQPARAPAPHTLGEACVRMYVRDKGLIARGHWRDKLLCLMSRTEAKCEVRTKRMPPHIGEFFRKCRTAGWLSVREYHKLVAADPSLLLAMQPPNYSRPSDSVEMEDRPQWEIDDAQEYWEGRTFGPHEELQVEPSAGQRSSKK